MRGVRSFGTGMRFVPNFTPPEFQAKTFTQSISSNFNRFSEEKTHRMSENEEIYTAGKNFTLPPAAVKIFVQRCRILHFHSFFLIFLSLKLLKLGGIDGVKVLA